MYATELIGWREWGRRGQREQPRLEHSGLVAVRAVGKQKHDQANGDAPLFSELCGIVQKTIGLADPLREALRPFESQIEAASYMVRSRKEPDTAGSRCRVMVISDELKYADVFAALEDVGVRVGRQVNPTILSRKEWRSA